MHVKAKCTVFIEYCTYCTEGDNGRAVWYVTIVNVLVLCPHGHVADRAVARGHCPASQEMIGLHVASPGIKQNSKFKVLFLLNAHCSQQSQVKNS